MGWAGGFGAKLAKRRLLETSQHILQVTRDLNSIRPGGEGFASSVKVRLRHARVRRHILALARERPGYFDVGAWGVPHQRPGLYRHRADLFVGACLGGPATAGHLPAPARVSRLLGVVAYVLGTSTDPWLVDRASRVMFESLIEADIDPSDMSAVLANNILTGLSCQPPTYVSREFLCAESYWPNGWELSRAPGIERPSLWHQALVAGQCLYFMGTCYLYRSIPEWDERKNEVRSPPQPTCRFSFPHRSFHVWHGHPRVNFWRKPKTNVGASSFAWPHRVSKFFLQSSSAQQGDRPRERDQLRLQIRAAARPDHRVRPARELQAAHRCP